MDGPAVKAPRFGRPGGCGVGLSHDTRVWLGTQSPHALFCAVLIGHRWTCDVLVLPFGPSLSLSLLLVSCAPPCGRHLDPVTCCLGASSCERPFASCVLLVFSFCVLRFPACGHFSLCASSMRLPSCLGSRPALLAAPLIRRGFLTSAACAPGMPIFVFNRHVRPTLLLCLLQLAAARSRRLPTDRSSLVTLPATCHLVYQQQFFPWVSWRSPVLAA